MNRKLWFMVLVIFVLAAILPLSGCSDDDDGGSMMAPAAANPAFTGTFVGMVTVTRGGQVSTPIITVNLKVNSPLSGDFVTTDGVTGQILEGSDASGNSATFSATTDDAGCAGTVEGNIELDNGNIAISATGVDCNDEVFSIEGDTLVAQPEDCTDPLSPDCCGTVVCPLGTECCNALLSICVVPGNFCIQNLNSERSINK